ncbi:MULTISPECIES: O-antigen ligase family protein [unclassified Pseudomonas]|jgi:O-antigen ligase|uniref:O-antigen ligase family protein n=1 Tax=unclassified Pseudomonas TaxID=196821 RepID=UPI001CBA99EE|nr:MULTISPECIES: O-antigen ligase family protein [unclassified Pseudomonas]UCP09947.1 O-antigen ligase family protein [Pseudomonas sp. MM213]
MRKVNFISIGAALVVFASVATALRFGKLPLGIGELAVMFLFLWALRYKQALRYLTHPIMLFWVGFMVIAAVAALISPVKGGSSVHTAMAYVYTACFSLMALACLEKATQEEFNSFIKALTVIPLALLVIPFLCLMTNSPRLAEWIGMNTLFPSRLSAWSTNPNQLALFLLPIPIWAMAACRESNWQGLRWLRNFLFFWMLFTVGLSVRSDALLLAWAISLPLLTIVALRWVKQANWKIFATMLFAFLVAFGSFKLVIDAPGRQMLIGKSDSVLGVGFDENKGGARKILWAHAAEAWMKSPIIGHGPGAFSYFDDPEVKQEAHNLGFDILTQTGIAGVLLMGALYLWLLFNAYRARDPYSLAVLVVLMVFSGAHFTLRQPVFSLYMIICALAVKNGSFTTVREKPQPL